MAPSPSNLPSLTSFHALSFDVFGTLVDEPTGLTTALSPLASRLPETHPAHPAHPASHTTLLAAFAAHEQPLLTTSPQLLYPAILQQAYAALAAEWQLEIPPTEAAQFSHSIETWPAFPDTVAAMQTLGKYYKLIALSNISNAAIGRVLAGPLAGPLAGVEFTAVYTAEEIGSYKPSRRNFEFLLEGVGAMGVGRGEVLHVAHGWGSDMVPAGEMGMWRAWIDRGEGREGGGYEWRWGTVGEMAGEVERAFGEGGRGD